MKNGEDEILMYELEEVVEEAADAVAQEITDKIYQLSGRLNRLRPIARTRAATDHEGRYVHTEVARLKMGLNELNDKYMQMHNLQLNTA